MSSPWYINFVSKGRNPDGSANFVPVYKKEQKEHNKNIEPIKSREPDSSILGLIKKTNGVVPVNEETNKLPRASNIFNSGQSENTKRLQEDKKKALKYFMLSYPHMTEKQATEIFETYLKNGTFTIKDILARHNPKNNLKLPNISGSGLDIQKTSNFKLLGFEKSHLKNKKYNAILQNKITGHIKKVPFGSVYYQQYKDSTGLKLYSHLDHNDKKRRELYYKRHNKDYPKFSPDYFSKKYLW